MAKKGCMQGATNSSGFRSPRMISSLVSKFKAVRMSDARVSPAKSRTNLWPFW